MSFDRSDEFTDKLQALADASGDLDLQVAYGTPGSRIQVRNEMETTGAAWETPSFMTLLAGAVGALAGTLEKEDFTVSVGYVTLSTRLR